MPIATLEMSLPKMPTPIRCELADNLSLEKLSFGIFGSYKKAVMAPIIKHLGCKVTPIL